MSRVTLPDALLAPRHLIFTALEGALVNARTDSFSGAEEAVQELARRRIPLILLTSRTRAEVEPIRRKLEHSHPFVTESGGGIFFPDGYFNIRIPGAIRIGRYLAIAQGRPYAEICATLDELAEECGVGVAGFHNMSLREIAENLSLRSRDAQLAREREFDEPFFFTSADDKAIARFVEAARGRGFETRSGIPFWHLCSGCDVPRAVRTLARIFRDATRTKLRLIGVGASHNDLCWLEAVDVPIRLPDSPDAPDSIDSAEIVTAGEKRSGGKKPMISGNAPGPAGWNEAVLNAIS